MREAIRAAQCKRTTGQRSVTSRLPIDIATAPTALATKGGTRRSAPAAFAKTANADSARRLGRSALRGARRAPRRGGTGLRGASRACRLRRIVMHALGVVGLGKVVEDARHEVGLAV